MKIIYTTACVAKDERMISLLKESAKFFDITLQPYGVDPDSSYKGWVDIKIDKFCEAARGWIKDGYTNVFYTDGRDSFFLSSAGEIKHKYIQGFDCAPYVISCEDQPYPFHELGPTFPEVKHPWRYLGAGQFMGEIKYMIDLWDKLRPLYSNLERENHDQGWLQRAWADGVLNRAEFILDSDCVIFQTASVRRKGADIPNYFELNNLEIKEGRVLNPLTIQCPCALHLPGGYSDPITGKEQVLRPLWEAIRRSQ